MSQHYIKKTFNNFLYIPREDKSKLIHILLQLVLFYKTAIKTKYYVHRTICPLADCHIQQTLKSETPIWHIFFKNSLKKKNVSSQCDFIICTYFC